MGKPVPPERLKENEEIRERIKKTISSKNMKLKQFARESGMAYPSLRDYYSGLRKPGFDAIATLLSYTGVSADWLLLGQGQMFPEDESPLANLDAKLLGKIAQEVKRIELTEYSEWGKRIKDNSLSESEYQEVKDAYNKTLQQAGVDAVIYGSVYNRIANINDPKRREDAINRESQVLLSVNATLSELGGINEDIPSKEDT